MIHLGHREPKNDGGLAPTACNRGTIMRLLHTSVRLAAGLSAVLAASAAAQASELVWARYGDIDSLDRDKAPDQA